jgi:hypothetical protein
MPAHFNIKADQLAEEIRRLRISGHQIDAVAPETIRNLGGHSIVTTYIIVFHEEAR